MGDTNGEKVSLNDAAGVASILLGSAQDATGVDATDHGVQDLAKYVQHTREAVAAVRPEVIARDQVPTAVAELVAVVAATEEATSVFLDVAEQLESLSGDLADEVAAKLTAMTTAIYEAAGFQDITGQRISKVQSVLKEIEDSVAEITDAIGYQPDPDAPSSESASGADEAWSDQDHLNGPAMPGSGNTQDDIDALFD